MSYRSYKGKEKIIYIQGDQLNMAVFFWYTVKSDLFSVRYCTHVYTDNALNTRYQKNTAMFNW